MDLFTKAIAKQIEILKYVSNNFFFFGSLHYLFKTALQTICGHGSDNHLLGIREMSRLQSDKNEPCALFREKAYKEYLNYRLSTSQLPTEKGIMVGYGAVVPDGYG